ncbi:ABC transporter permease [Pseudooceanicola sp. CBS1P-1]|uniref:Spermidine/putrescine transport system permease protein PotC n=1 Tax=Pseudooceanicola albus TaxID=2692189 RepID=A0A6L7G8A1_9RHOB|nr:MULTISPECIES: ABC transporter permease [Pseudooceanicola]MBT9385933.1 ABC transporter permease [Pseudooceanicola endophyticus]MXN19646.1 ABC transporter permease subunit [Pseudooceanicola albus]
MTRHFDTKSLPGFGFITLLCFLMLYLPIAVLVVFAFNAGTSIAIWQGFSLRWFVSAAQNDQVIEASIRSLQIAVVAAGLATVSATLAALATTRTKGYRGMKTKVLLFTVPLMVPEIVTAVALLIVVARLKVWTGYTGLGYLILSHAAFCVPFAYMPIRARLAGMDSTLEAAAMDLYASRWQCFRHITLPLLTPGIIAGFMLAFVISLDDVVITEFVKSAGQDTLPTYMLGQLRRNITPEINAISTAFLALSVVLIVVFYLVSNRKKT